MGGKKIAAVVVLVLIVLGAVGYMIWGQGKPAPPPEVMQKTAERIQASEPFEVRAFSNADWAKASVDPATSYRKIDGKLWAEKVACISCSEAIPAAPVKADSKGPLQLGKHMCPRCGKPAYMAD